MPKFGKLITTQDIGTVVTTSATSINLAVTDAGNYIVCNASGTINVQVTKQSSVDWEPDTLIEFEQNGTGRVIIAGDTGVSVNCDNLPQTAGQYAVISLKRIGADEWIVAGNTYTGATGNSFGVVSVPSVGSFSAETPDDTLNVVGGAGISLTVNSTTDTLTITNSANTFSTVAVTGQQNVVAESLGDTLNFEAGAGITITTNSTTDTITIANTATAANAFGIFAVNGQQDVVADSTSDTLTLTAGTGITITTDSTTDAITITNTVTAPNTFSTFAVSGQQDVVADSTTDTLTLVAGSGIAITTNSTTDAITLANSANTFSTFAVTGQSAVVADSLNDTVTFTAGSGITITTDTTTDTITIANTGVASNAFSIFAVNGQQDVVADSSADTLTLAAGFGILLTTDSTTDTITIDNDAPSFTTFKVTGSSDIVPSTQGETITFTAASGITLTGNSTTDTITIENTAKAFGTFAVTGQNNVEADTNSGTLNLVAGSGITITTNSTTDTITFTNSGSVSNAFSTFAVSGQQDVVADSSADTVTFVAGSGITITTDSTTDTITFTSSGAAPAGSSGQIQFNNSGAFGANSNLVWDNTNSRLGVAVAAPAVRLDVSSSAYVVQQLTSTNTSGTTSGATLSLIQNDGTTTQNNEFIGRVGAGGFVSGTGVFAEQAHINFNAAGNWTSGSRPTYIGFATTGATLSQERMRVTSGGSFIIGGTGNDLAKLMCTGNDSSSGTVNFRLRNSGNTETFLVNNTGDVGISVLPNALYRLLIRGLNATSSNLALRCENSAATKTFEIRNDGGFSFFGGTTGLPQTGYTTFTNLTTDRTCDANNCTIDELADILGTLIVDLKTKGIIAA